MRRAPARPVIDDSEILARTAVDPSGDAGGCQRCCRRRSFDPERGEEASSWSSMVPLDFLRALDPQILRGAVEIHSRLARELWGQVGPVAMQRNSDVLRVSDNLLGREVFCQ